MIFKTDPAIAVDAAGKEQRVAVHLEASEASRGTGERFLEVTLHADAPSYPVVVDPSWSPGGQLTTARFAHAAVPLPDGRVLIVGGQTSDDGTPRRML